MIRLRTQINSIAWREQLRESGIDSQASRLVEQVVAHTRLSLAEKTQVAAELIAHFEDGQRQGIGSQQLIEDFGDPQLAAKLIRRGKIRNRTMANKLWRGGLWGVAGLSVAYVLMYWYFTRGVPTPTVDYLAKINESILDVPAEDRAWAVYRDVMAKTQFIEGPGGRFEEIYFQNPEGPDHLRLMEPGDGEQWQRCIEKLAASQELLDVLREGGQRPYLGIELQNDRRKYSPEDQKALFPSGVPEDGRLWPEMLKMKGWTAEAEKLLAESTMSVLLPHVQSQRNATRILTVDTRWAIEQGDYERAVQNIEAMYGFSRHASESRFLVGTLVGCAVSGMACDAVGETLIAASDKLSPEQLARIQRAIERDNMWDLVDLNAEKMFFDDLLQRTFTDDGQGDGRITAVGLRVFQLFGSLNSSLSSEQATDSSLLDDLSELGQVAFAPMSMLIMPTRRQYQEAAEEFYAQAEEAFRTPYHENPKFDFRALVDDQLQLLNWVLPGIEQVRNAVARTDMNRQATAAAVAVYRFHRETGRWPERAEELIPGYLTAMPRDAFNGQLLRYQAIPGGFQIYGLGYDEDDDGGMPVMVRENDGNLALQDRPIYGNNSEVPDAELRRQFASEYLPFIQRRGPDGPDGDWIAWPRK